MSSNTTLQRKRRIVPIQNRKRALFSCDRCKIRKIKCRRIQDNDLKYDNITPCIQCTKAGVACTTSIPRKKRFYGPIENINLHYRCLLALITGLFPDKDIYNIEELIELGRVLKLEMPSMDTSTENMELQPPKHGEFGFNMKKEDTEELHIHENIREEEESDDERSQSEEEQIKTENQEKVKASKEFKIKPKDKTHLHKIDKRSTETDTKEVLARISSLPPSVKIKNNYDSERLIMDRFGHTHFIGNFGTASLLNGLCDIIIKRSTTLHPPTSTQDIRDSTVQTITSENEPVYQYPTHLYNLDTINVDRFPLINLISKQEADIYVEVFFEKVHPYYFIFNRRKFNERYSVFWDEIHKPTEERGDEPLHMSSAEICCIYMVWILGRRFQLYSNPKETPKGALLDSDMINRYVDIIRLTLSDVVLTPTIDGIRLLFLLSTYLSSIKVRESGYCLMQMAAIQAKGMGLHRKLIVDKFNDEKSDEMKRIMWSLAKNESILCCSLGRASAVPWEEMDIGLPLVKDETDELFKTYYTESVKLTKIIFEILDYKKRVQKEPLSLSSLEKALSFQKDLQQFWDNLPEPWKDYKSLPIRRYKPKLHIQYHYYFIALTLPMFMQIVNSPNYVIKQGDPLLTLLVHGIQSSFQTAELVTYTDANGFFNGTIYYDVFYCYNAIMILTLTYILFIGSKSGKRRSKIDLEYLDSEYGINLHQLLKEINMIRKLILSNLHKIDGTMRRMSDLIETLLEDLGIIHTLVKEYNAPKSNAKRIEGGKESGQTSVSASLPGSFRKLKFNLHHHERKKRRRTKKDMSPPVRARRAKSVATEIRPQNKLATVAPQMTTSLSDVASFPQVVLPDPDKQMSEHPENFSSVPLQYRTGSLFSNIGPARQTPEDLQQAQDVQQQLIESSTETEGGPTVLQGSFDSDSSTTPASNNNINDVLTSMALNTDLMDALFGSELLNNNSE